MAGGRIAVQVDRADFLQHSMKFDQARGHHGEVGHHVAVAEEGAEGAHGIGDAAPSTSLRAGSALDDLLEGGLGVHVPLPGVFEGHDLGTGAGAIFFGEEDVVVLAAVEGRVEVDEVDGLVLDVLAEDGEVVAVIELVLLHCGAF